MNKYLEIKRKHQEEVNNFPMAFAFNREQFIEGMSKLGLEKTDTNKIINIGCGGFTRRENKGKLKEMYNRHEMEMSELIASDTTGDNFIFDMFNYELSSHEYCYTRDFTDTLASLRLSNKDILSNPALKHGLEKAAILQREE